VDISEFASSLAQTTEREKSKNPFDATAAEHLPSPKPTKEVSRKLLASPAVDHRNRLSPAFPAFSPQRRASGIIESSFAFSEAASPSVQWKFNKLMQGPGNKALTAQVAAERLEERLEGRVPDPDAGRFQFDTEAEGKELAESIRQKASTKLAKTPRMKMTGRFQGSKRRDTTAGSNPQSADEKITRAAAKRAHFMDRVNTKLGQAIGRKDDSGGVSTVVQGKVRAHTQYRIRKLKHGQDNSMKHVPRAERPSSVASAVAQGTLSLLEKSGKAVSEDYHKHMTADTRGHLLQDSGAVNTSDTETTIRESRMRISGQT